MVFWHEYVKLTYLRTNGYDNCKYIKRIQSYFPLKDNRLCETCFSDTDGHGTKCVLLKSPLMIIVQKTSQLIRDFLGTSPEGSLKILTSGAYRGHLGDSQETNTKTYDVLIKKLFFRSSSDCITYLFLLFTKTKKPGDSKVLKGDVHGTSTGPSCRTSREPKDGRSRDVLGTSV